MTESERDDILMAASRHIPFEGWTMTALERGAEDLGRSRFDAQRAFPNGVRQAIDHLADWADRQALSRIQADGAMDEMGFTQKVTFGARARLEALEPHKELMVRAIGGRLIPGHFSAGAKAVLRSADRIWDAVGDSSTDINWYTKRGLLATVIAATTIYWCRDTSPDHEQTWDYLDRRINDALRVGKAAGQARDMAARVTPQPILNILGSILPAPKAPTAENDPRH
ncbi:MAG: COQ9 family protein [Alphaproteobacteria bacterium]